MKTFSVFLTLLLFAFATQLAIALRKAGALPSQQKPGAHHSVSFERPSTHHYN